MKDLVEKETLAIKYRKFVDRKDIAAKQADPFLLQVNGNEYYPLFVDIRDNLLVTGQTLSAAPAYAINLTKQLLTKKHIIHAKTTYDGANGIWFFLHTFGFVAEGTAERHITRGNHEKDSHRFAFHIFDDKHSLVEDSFNGGGPLFSSDINKDAPVDVVFYLKQYAHPSVDEILNANKPLSAIIDDLRDSPGALITKLIHKGSSDKSEIPSLASLPAGFNHLIISYNASESALEYRNRLHMRDVLEACQIYFTEQSLTFGWKLQSKPMGHWVIMTPDNEPVLQRANTMRSKYYYTWDSEERIKARNEIKVTSEEQRRG